MNMSHVFCWFIRNIYFKCILWSVMLHLIWLFFLRMSPPCSIFQHQYLFHCLCSYEPASCYMCVSEVCVLVYSTTNQIKLQTSRSLVRMTRWRADSKLPRIKIMDHVFHVKIILSLWFEAVWIRCINIFIFLNAWAEFLPPHLFSPHRSSKMKRSFSVSLQMHPHLRIRTAESFQISIFRFEKSSFFSWIVSFLLQFKKKINKCIDNEINDTIFARFEVIMTYCT